MNITRWEPFREMDEIVRQYSTLLDTPRFARSPRRQLGEMTRWMPLADISETDGEFLIKADLPEVKKADVKVTLQDGALTISGERKHEKKQKGENEIRVESFYGSFSRTFALPDNVDAQGIRAETKDGVLRVHVPKRKGAITAAKQIEVK